MSKFNFLNSKVHIHGLFVQISLFAAIARILFNPNTKETRRERSKTKPLPAQGRGEAFTRVAKTVFEASPTRRPPQPSAAGRRGDRLRGNRSHTRR